MRTQILTVLVITIASAFTIPQIAAGAETDYLDEHFRATPSTWTESWFDGVIGTRNQITSITDGVEGKAINVKIPAGSHFGTAAQYRFADQSLSDPDELYYRYYIRLPTSFVNYGTGKIPGPAGLYSSSGRNKVKPSNANPGWSARMQFSPSTTPVRSDTTQLGFYVYHRDQAGDAGDSFLWDPSAGVITHGQWQCIEGHVSMNTPGAKNGILEGWVDEQLAFYKGDLRFLGSADSALGIQSFWFDTFFGGTNPAPAELNIQFDELKLSSERIGCGGLAERRFTDTAGNVHEGNIERLADARITLGCNPPANDQFCPKSSVNRGQMAAFLTRALDLPPPVISNRFGDDDESVFEDSIDRLAEAKITVGCNPPSNTQFCPNQPVTRGQMAAFLTRAITFAGPTTNDRFVDDDDSEFEAAIDRLASAGVTQGCNPPTNDRFCPSSFVTRAEMATFLARALNLPAPPVVVYAGPFVPSVPAGYDATVPVGWSIEAVSKSQPEGAAIFIEAGLHSVQAVEPRDGQSFQGAGLAILDGEDLLFEAFSGDGVGVSVTGLEIQNYSRGLFVEAADWSLADMNLHDNDLGIQATGDRLRVENSTFDQHAEEAIRASDASNIVVTGSTFTASNQSMLTTYSAAIKLIGTVDAVIESNVITDTHGYGIWFTGGATGTQVVGNTVYDNLRAGIVHDYAYGSTIVGNSSTGNGRLGYVGVYLGSGILVFGPDATVTDNLVGANYSGIVLFTHSSGLDGPSGLYIPSGALVTGNQVIESGRNGASPTSYNAVYDTSEFQDNDYTYADVDGRHWGWNGISYIWTDWQSIGMDTTGTFGQ